VIFCLFFWGRPRSLELMTEDEWKAMVDAMAAKADEK